MYPPPCSALHMETRKKKTLTKNYGSFQLEGLMEKAAVKRKELDADKAAKDRNEKAVDARNEKAKNDALQFKLCARFCICPDQPCIWAHHVLCEETTCGQVINPMANCMSAICKAIRQKRKKETAAAKAEQDKANEASYAKCKGTNAVCVCDNPPCKWEHWGMCENPPCTILLAPFNTCKKRACSKWRKDQGIQTRPRPRPRPKAKAKKKKPAQTSARVPDTDSNTDDSEAIPSPRSQPKRKRTATKKDLPSPLDVSSSASASDSGPSSPPKLTRDKTETLQGEYEISRILEGPRKDGKYLVSWEGYGSDGNTWEPRCNLPDDIDDMWDTDC